MYTFEMRIAWFWANYLSISTLFFSKDSVIVQSQKRYVIFSPKELQKEQDDVVGSPKTKVHSDKGYCSVSFLEPILNTCLC